MGFASLPPPVTQTKGGWNTDPNGAAKTGWQYLTSIWGGCLSDFKQIADFSASQFQQLLTAGNMNGGIVFWDTRYAAIASRTVYSVIHSGSTTVTLQQYVGDADADTLSGTNNVILGINFFTDLTQTQQIAAAIHEALHVELDIGDATLKQDLAAFGFVPQPQGTGDITDWISNDCSNPKPNQ